MAKYQYSALKNNRQIIKGEVEASCAREAREKIRQLGFLPTKVYTEEAIIEDYSQNSSTDDTADKKVKRLSLQEKIFFTSELQVLLSSGIPIVSALHTVEKNTPKPKIATICHKIAEKIMAGMTFAQAMTSLYGSVFGPVYTALMKTGEEAGELEVTLDRMLVLLRKQERIKDKIISASIYPTIVVALMVGLLILFSKLVFPVFYGMLNTNGIDLPIYSQMLIGFCQFIDKFWWLVLVGIGAFSCAITSMFHNIAIKSKWDNFVLKIPAVSEFIKYINLSNFMSVLHVAYEAGMPIMDCIELATKTIGNNTIKNQATYLITYIKRGLSLSEAFERTNILPNALHSLVATGEKSGTLGKMFRDVADVIDKKVDIALTTLSKLFEPTLIIVMGICVGFIALGIIQMYYATIGAIL